MLVKFLRNPFGYSMFALPLRDIFLALGSYKSRFRNFYLIFSKLGFVKKNLNPIFALAFGTRVSLFSKNVGKKVL